MEEYKRCQRCVMTDRADPGFALDENGHCNYCTRSLQRRDSVYFPNQEGARRLEAMLSALKEKNRNKPYDCLMGISGGLDSAYLAYLGATKWGLRIAAIHIDDGFDTQVARENIRKLCEKCGVALTTIRPDEKQFYALTRAYLLAGVPNLAVPQDNVLFSAIYRFALENRVQDFLSGDNFALECVLQTGNTISAYDLVNLRDINRRFGTDKLDNLPLMSHWRRMAYRSLLHVREYYPLNLIDYNKNRAIAELRDFCDFHYYEAKHLENYFTGFLQLCWLPQKFGVDKRTSHFSSLIVNGQMTREEALALLEAPPGNREWMERAVSMVKEKLSFTDEAFQAVMDAPPHQHGEYRLDGGLALARRAKRAVARLRASRREG